MSAQSPGLRAPLILAAGAMTVMSGAAIAPGIGELHLALTSGGGKGIDRLVLILPAIVVLFAAPPDRPDFFPDFPTLRSMLRACTACDCGCPRRTGEHLRLALRHAQPARTGDSDRALRGNRRHRPLLRRSRQRPYEVRTDRLQYPFRGDFHRLRRASGYPELAIDIRDLPAGPTRRCTHCVT